MVKFSILVPDATVNYVKNPSLRYDTTNWNAQGASISRVLTQARFGMSSLQVVTNGSAVNEGAYYRTNDLTNVSELITGSVYVRGTGKVRLRVIANPSGQQRVSESVFLRLDRWTRLSATVMSIGSNDFRLYVETDEGSAKARTFFVDGAQIERKAYPTTYCDGEQEGCRWSGLYHNSTSLRSAYTRAGGRWVQLAGEERAAEDLYMTVVGGLGVAPITNNIQPFALEAGSYFQNVKVLSRVVTLSFFAKHQDKNSGDGLVTMSALHQLRQFLIDVVKPDKTGGNEEIWFEYQDGDKPLYFRARYDGGLEGEWDVRNKWVNSFPLRLLAVSPLIHEDSQDVASIDFQETIPCNLIAGRINGQWSNVNYGFSGGTNPLVSAAAKGTRGEVVMGGVFNSANANAAAVDPLIPANHITYWDGQKWNKLSTGANSTVRSVAVAPNGNIYAGGQFTSIGGVAANRIAFWNGSTWNALGTGLNDQCYEIVIGPNGYVYAGGDFTTAGGVSCFRVAYWDGFQWRRLGQYGGLNGNVRSMAMTPDGATLYVGGQFTDEQGNPGSDLSGIASYNILTGLFSAMGSGFNNTIDFNSLIQIGIDGRVYVGGSFTASGSTTLNRIAYWNGSAWVPMGTGVSTNAAGTSSLFISSIAVDKNGNLWVAGSMDTWNGIPSRFIAFWNGSSWATQDIFVPTKTLFNGTKVIVTPEGDIYLGFATTTGNELSQIKVAGITLVTNPGTSETQPIVYISGAGHVAWLENQSTGKRVYLNLDVLSGEEVFIDFGRGKIYSAARPDLLYTIVPGSDFLSFSLIPGENKIAAFAYNDVGMQVTMQVPIRHWSIDETQNEESL